MVLTASQNMGSPCQLLIRVNDSRVAVLQMHYKNRAESKGVQPRRAERSVCKKAYYLHQALVKLSSRRAMQCLIYLNECHRSVGLDEIEEVKGTKKVSLMQTSDA